MAERAGFEPAVPCDTLALQASALDHYATSPRPSRPSPFRVFGQTEVTSLNSERLLLFARHLASSSFAFRVSPSNSQFFI